MAGGIAVGGRLSISLEVVNAVFGVRQAGRVDIDARLRPSIRAITSVDSSFMEACGYLNEWLKSFDVA
jgi:hypothetical protein